MDWGDWIEGLAMIQALLIFIGVLLSTSLHPRVAMITSTLEHALSDIFHFTVIFLLVLLSFAIIGTWRFGALREDMSTIFRTMCTQMDAILGPPGTLMLSDLSSAGTLEHEYFVYVFLLHVVNFFCLVNFFLAIIVNGYTRHSVGTEYTDVENDIISDAVIGFLRLWYGIRYGWSSNRTIALAVSELPSTFIATSHLTSPRFCHVFPNTKSAEAFHKFYCTWVSNLTRFDEGQLPEYDVKPLVLAMESRQNVRLTRSELMQSLQMKVAREDNQLRIERGGSVSSGVVSEI